MNRRSIVHIEMPSADHQVTKDFYTSLCGWDVNETPMGGDYVYNTFVTGNVFTALTEIGETNKPGDVILYFGSDDLDADLAKVQELGGKVVVPKQEVEGFGAYGIFMDPTGNKVAFWQEVPRD